MIPLKKCPSCGDEWITDQTSVKCLLTEQLTELIVIDPEPIDDDYVQDPCPAGKHPYSENYYRFVRKNGKVEQGCRLCRRERNLAAVKKYKAAKLAYQSSVQEQGLPPQKQRNIK